jgi:hypothetical protein
VQLDGQQSAVSTQTTSYFPPALNALVLDSKVQGFRTMGGERVVIAGTNFGPSGTAVKVFYGISTLPNVRDYASSDMLKSAIVGSGGYYYEARSCEVKNHTSIACETAPGVGPSGEEAGHTWWADVGDQYSSTSRFETRYLPPRVTGVFGPGAHGASTAGGEIVYISGENLGPMSTPTHAYAVRGLYGPESNVRKYEATSCEIWNPHTLMVCLTAEGTGTGHSWGVDVDSQRSGVFNAGTGYAVPVITLFRGEGAVDASTEGAERVIIEG